MTRHAGSTVIQRAGERFLTKTDWLESWHSFSFAEHYDPKNTRHGLLLVNNDDIIQPGRGFGTHSHQDMEIVTWVIEGELKHRDTLGNEGIITPGLAQRMSAGTGISHSEMNPSADRAVRLIQMWVLPDTKGIAPGYQQMDVGRALERGGLVPIASGRGHDGAVTIRQKNAVLWGGRPGPNEAIQLPDGRDVHLFIARGSVRLEDGKTLMTGDSARCTEAGTMEIRADPVAGAEVLIWAMS